MSADLHEEGVGIVERFSQTLSVWRHSLTRNESDHGEIVRSLEAFLSLVHVKKKVRIEEFFSAPEIRLACLMGDRGSLYNWIQPFHSRNYAYSRILGVVHDLHGRVRPLVTMFENLTTSFLRMLCPISRGQSDILRRIRGSSARDAIQRMSYGGIAAVDCLCRAVRGSKSDPKSSQDCTSNAEKDANTIEAALECLQRAMLAGAGWIIEGQDTLWVVPIPRIRCDRRFRLHSEKEAAVVWSNGLREFYWRGVHVPNQFVLDPQNLTARRILAERNVELRRVMIERVGLEKLIRDSAAQIVDKDIDYGGERQLLRIDLSADEPVVAVRVICPSSRRSYILRVPPTTRSCQDAIAWTFGFSSQEYVPLVET
jgi:hypothetical protein